MVALTMAAPVAQSTRVVSRRGAPSMSSRRRGAVVIRASWDDASPSDATSKASGDAASASSSYGSRDTYIPPPPPRRETPLERLVKDPFAAAIMAPRVALGGLDLLSKGELFTIAAKEVGEVSALLNDPRPIQDKAADAFKRAEMMVEMLEARGVVAEAPGRELVRSAIPTDLYEKYLDPAALEPAPAWPSTSTNTYTAEPVSYTTTSSTISTTREVEIPEPESFSTASSNVSVPKTYTYTFDDAEDPAVAAAAAAVAAALGDDDDDDGDMDGNSHASISSPGMDVSDVDLVAKAEAPAATTSGARSDARSSPALETPAPPADAWSAVKEAESLAAELVMSQSAVIAMKEAKLD